MKRKYKVLKTFVFLGKALLPNSTIETIPTLKAIKDRIRDGYLEEIRDVEKARTKKKRNREDAEPAGDAKGGLSEKDKNPDAAGTGDEGVA